MTQRHRQLLRTSTAMTILASAFGIAAMPATALAQCAVNAGTLQCADTTVDVVNTNINAQPGPNLILSIPAGSIAGLNQVFVPALPFVGSVAVNNVGTIGSVGAFSGIFVTGASDKAGNNVAVSNTGTINGSLTIVQTGGTGTINSKGAVTGSIQTTGAGAQTVTVAGTVGGSVAASTVSTATPNTNKNEAIAGGGNTNTATFETKRSGDAATITVAEGAEIGGNVTATGLKSAAVVFDGKTLGTVTASTGPTNTNSTQTFTTVTDIAGKTTATSNSFKSGPAFGDARVTLGEKGSVAGNVIVNGFNTTTSIAGQVVGSVQSVGSGAETFNTTSSTFDPATGQETARQTSNSSKAVGGTAAATVTQTGVVGGLFVVGRGGASVSVDGIVKSGVTVNSTGQSTTLEVNETNNLKGTRTGTGSATTTQVGRTAVLEVGAKGAIAAGGVNVSGHEGATVKNAGIIIGGATVTSTGTNTISGNAFLPLTGQTTQQATVINTGDAKGSTNSTATKSQTVQQTIGGIAALTNVAGDPTLDSLGNLTPGALITGNVNVNGFGGTVVSNAGTVEGGVTQNSNGQRTETTNISDVSTVTVALDKADVTKGATTTFTNAGTFAQTTTRNGGSSAFDNAAGALITGAVNLTANKDVTATNAGKINGTLSAATAAQNIDIKNTNSFVQITTPTNAANLAGGNKFESKQSDTTFRTETSAGGSVKVANVAKATVGTDLNGTASGGATATVDISNAGTVKNSVTALSGGTLVTSATTFDDIVSIVAQDGKDNAKGTLTTDTTRTSSTNSTVQLGSTVAVTNVKGGAIGGNVTANANKGVTVTNGGTITGAVFANSNISDTSNSNASETKFVETAIDATDVTKGRRTAFSEVISTANASTQVGGTVSLVNETTGSIGSINSVGAGGITLANAGKIGSGVTLLSLSNNSKNGNTRDFSSVSAPINAADATKGVSNSFVEITTNSNQNTASGSTATVTNAATGVIGSTTVSAPVSVLANKAATVDNAGTIWGTVTVVSEAETNSSADTRTVKDSRAALDGKDASTASKQSVSRSDDFVNTFKSAQVGQSALVTNAATGTIAGNTDLRAHGDVSLTNAGAAFGSVTLGARGQAFEQKISTSETLDVKLDSKTVDPTKTTTAISTVTSFKTENASSINRTGGSATATVSGSVGVANPALAGVTVVPGLFPAATQVSLDAHKDATLTVSGIVAANVTSNAGTNNETFKQTVTANRSVVDTTVDLTVVTPLVTKVLTSTTLNGTRSSTNDQSFTSSRRADGGNSTVTISGVVGPFTGSAPVNVSSTGTQSSNVNVSGTVNGSVQSTGQSVNTTNQFSQADTWVITAGVERSDKGSTKNTSTSKVNATSSAINLTGAGVITGNATVQNSTTANVVVGATNKVGGNLTATVTGSDVVNESTTSYAFNATKTFDRVNAQTFTETAATTQGNASSKVDGTVGGTVETRSGLGSATALINNKVGSVSTQSAAFNRVFTSTDKFVSATATGAATRFVSKVSEDTFTAVGGTASTTLRAPAALAAANGVLVAGNVNTSGFKGATVDVGTGVIVNGAVSASSNFGSTKTTENQTFNATGVLDAVNRVSEVKASGGAVAVINAGSIKGGTFANSAGSAASLTNTGVIVNGSSVSSVGTSTVTSTAGTNLATPSADQEVTNETFSVTGGAATVTNSGSFRNGLNVAGATGTVTNTGSGDTVQLGQSVNNHVTTSTRNVSTTKVSTVANPVFVQSYKIEQSGLLTGNINVSGTTVGVVGVDPANPTALAPLTTSKIDATVNLNSGSVTLGGVFGEIDTKTGASLTQTDVNLIGSGHVGYSKAVTGVVPVLTDAQQAYHVDSFGTKLENRSVAGAIRGARNVTHSGAGTFFVTGGGYNDLKTATTADDVYDIKAATVSNTGGRLVLSTLSRDSVFSIWGNVTNSAELVFGTIATATPLANLNSLVGRSDVIVNGQRARIDGNLTQTATGTMFVAVTPDLVRTTPLSVTGASVPEVLGFANYQLNNGPFTFVRPVPGAVSQTAEVTVNGNLDLKGTLAAQVQRGAIYSGGSNVGIFNVTGTVALGASVVPLSGSNFVGFDVTSTKTGATTTVSLTTKRTSYGTAGQNSNARAAAGGLDSAVDTTLAAIKADALGTATFANVERFRQVQDVANVISGFDWLLSSAQVSTAVNELGSGEIYASLGTISTTASMLSALRGPTAQGVVSSDAILQLWATPSVQSTTYDGSVEIGAGELDVDDWSFNAGGRVQATPTFSFGFGLGYSEAEVDGVTRASTAKVTTYLVGADLMADFDKIRVSGQLAYGWSARTVQRQLPSFARVASANYDGTELGFRGEVSYAAVDGTMGILRPFAALSARSSSTDAFTETNGGGVGLVVEGVEQSIVQPEIGVRWSVAEQKAGPLSLFPYANVSYVFDGGGSDAVSQRLVGGGNAFSVSGIEQGAYAELSAGLASRFGSSGYFSFGAGGQFGGDQSQVSVSARLGLEF